MTPFSKKRGSGFFSPRLLKSAVLDQPTVDSGGFSREWYVALAVFFGIVASIRIDQEIQCLLYAGIFSLSYLTAHLKKASKPGDLSCQTNGSLHYSWYQHSKFWAFSYSNFYRGYPFLKLKQHKLNKEKTNYLFFSFFTQCMYNLKKHRSQSQPVTF